MGRNEVVIDVKVKGDTKNGFDSIEAESKVRAEKIGKTVGESLAKGADGRLRDSRGRFLSAGEGIGTELGKGAGKILTGSFADTFREVGAHGQAALIGMAAAAAPGIGAAISTAIIGGGGLLGVAGGVALAVRDPAVAAAGRTLGQTLVSGLESDAGSFIQPVLRSIDLIEDRFQQLRPTIQRIFSNSSRFLEPLVDSATRAFGSILRGIESLTAKGAPVMDSLGRTVEILGVSFERAFDIIAGGSEDAANSTNQMAESLGSLIIVSAGVIRGLTKVASVIVDINTEINDAVTFFPRLFGWMDKGKATAEATAPALRNVAEATLSTGEAAGQAGLNMATYGDKMSEAAGKGRSLFDSQTAVAESIANATKVLKENGKGLGVNTKEQLENRRAISQVAANLVKQYESYVKVNGEGANAAAIAGRNRASFITLARQFGLTAREANKLADDMGLLRDKKVNFYANTHDAAGRIAALKGDIASVKGKTVTVRVSVTGTERLDAAGRRIGGYKAAGGMTGQAASGATSSGLTWVGEQGPELIDAPPGTRVWSAGDSARMMRGGGGGGGGPVSVLVGVDPGRANNLMRAVMEALRFEVRRQGGNVQQVLGVAGR